MPIRSSSTARTVSLSDLHQLRGRVGRFTHKAYAYFIIPPRKQLSAQAKSRIDAIEKHSGLGAGFLIAFEDLQIRGAGNILGQEQHGYIATIGFDLYCRLLKESVEHLKKKWPTGSHQGTYGRREKKRLMDRLIKVFLSLF